MLPKWLPSAQKWFGRKHEYCLLQEVKKLESPLYRMETRAYDIDVLDWPAQSPDANPIETVWELMKLRLHGKRILKTKQLFRQIRLVWRSLYQGYAMQLVESIPWRCQAIIDNRGDWTNYE